MCEYLCVNGPLAGASVRFASGHTAGDLVRLEVVDVGMLEDDVALHDYRVEPGDLDGRRLLSHVILG